MSTTTCNIAKFASNSYPKDSEIVCGVWKVLNFVSGARLCITFDSSYNSLTQIRFCLIKNKILFICSKIYHNIGLFCDTQSAIIACHFKSEGYNKWVVGDWIALAISKNVVALLLAVVQLTCHWSYMDNYSYTYLHSHISASLI